MAEESGTGTRRDHATAWRQEPTKLRFGRTAIFDAADFHLPNGWVWVRSSPRTARRTGRRQTCGSPKNGHLFTRKSAGEASKENVAPPTIDLTRRGRHRESRARRHGIKPGPAPRCTAGQPLGAQPQSAQRAVFGERLHAIARTRRLVATPHPHPAQQ